MQLSFFIIFFTIFFFKSYFINCLPPGPKIDLITIQNSVFLIKEHNATSTSNDITTTKLILLKTVQGCKINDQIMFQFKMIIWF